MVYWLIYMIDTNVIVSNVVDIIIIIIIIIIDWHCAWHVMNC